MPEIEKMSLESLNIREEQLRRLKEIFPEVFTEGYKIDYGKLKLTLGENIDAGKERFGLNWPGKADCFKTIQTPSVATLEPCREESVNFDNTENLFIEGDNLEVLKLLQKSYSGKIKMIYIDPPYNTGKNFIYPDDYTGSLQTYLEYTGQVDSEGRRYTANTEADGRFHSKWLNMMYPRLFLAKNLLREDGIVFISIDDNEQSNLKKLCDELFGEENLLANLVWDLGTGTAAGHFTRAHEYILVYAKRKESLKNFQYDGPEDIISERAVKKISKGNPPSQITFPKGMEYKGPDSVFNNELGKKEKIRIINGPMIFENNKLVNSVTLEAGWAMRDQILSWIDGEETYDSKGQKVINFYFDEKGVLQYEKIRGVINPPSVIRNIGSTRKGSSELETLFDSKVFDFPKPIELLKRIVNIVTAKKDIILDFFSGTCPLAHAVMELNKEDGGSRKYICVQLPELTDENSEAYKAGYKTIADIGKERIRRVIKRYKEEREEKAGMFDNDKLDLGFRAFKLKRSNFKIWNADIEKDPEKIQEALELHVDNLTPEAKRESILYELLLKSGVKLSTPVESLSIEGKTVFSIDLNEGKHLICLEKQLTRELIKAIADLKPQTVICLDEGFQNNDQLKTNAALMLKSKGVVIFQTV